MTEKESLLDTIELGFYRINTSTGGEKLTNGKDYHLLSVFAKRHQHFEGKTIHTLDTQPDAEPWPVVKLTVDFSKPYGKIPDEPLLNIAPPAPIKSENIDKDVTIFWKHLENLCGRVDNDTKEWVKDWLADIFQNPMNKPGTALSYRSEQGTGKSLFWNDLMKALLGERHIETSHNIFEGRFNNEAKNKLLINLNEVSLNKNIGKVKGFITEPEFSFEEKGKNRVLLPNHARLVLTTNEEVAVKDEDSRRFCMLNPKLNDYKTPDYFKNLGAAIEDEDTIKKFLYELETRNITHNLREVPKTDEYYSQQEMTKKDYDSWLEEVLTDDNYITKDGAALWIETDENKKICKSETATDDFNKRYKKETKLFQRIKSKTEKLGYSVETTANYRYNGATARVWIFTKVSGHKKILPKGIHDFLTNLLSHNKMKNYEYPAPPVDLKTDIPYTQNSLFSVNNPNEDKKTP